MDLESLSADEYSLEDQDFYESNPRPIKMTSNSKPFRKVVVSNVLDITYFRGHKVRLRSGKFKKRRCRGKNSNEV